ncbi:MAG: hypothetical protein WAV41_01815 [Microgenomates group bacterium]
MVNINFYLAVGFNDTCSIVIPETGIVEVWLTGKQLGNIAVEI